jgi:hypothetical protein
LDVEMEEDVASNRFGLEAKAKTRLLGGAGSSVATECELRVKINQ